MIASDTPFVLLDDARNIGASPARLYRDPVRVLVAHTADEVAPLLAALEVAQRDGLHSAGYLSYDAGFALEPRLAEVGVDRPASSPLAWFGLFENYQSIDAMMLPHLLPDGKGAWIGVLQPEVARRDYDAAFDTVARYIVGGDIYQANLTFRALAHYAGHPLALYAALRPRAAAGYGGVIWTGEQWHLSFSPELFFALHDGRVTTKPMKGTAVRMADATDDAMAISKLRADPKQRAENLMIVDLLRNDLSRVAKAGTVAVPELFAVESYPTVHQMTSTVTAQLKDGLGAVDLLRAIFPCGSITGAPKIRAMEIIDTVESSARGVYCGSIGRIDAHGDAAFNVAIRTFSLNDAEKLLSVGLGSGLVADSVAGPEWDECLAKGEFARVQQPQFDLIETMRFEPESGIARLELHLDRMKDSARAFDFTFDRHEARNRLHAATFHLDDPAKIRLLAGRTGALAIEIGVLPAAAIVPIAVRVVPLPVDAQDFRLSHKTTDRAFYDLARIDAGVDEVIFENADGHLTEGSFTALFVVRGDHLVTPPLACGLLPSVLRRDMIESGAVIEGELIADDLWGEFYLGNSVRGLFPAKRVA